CIPMADRRSQTEAKKVPMMPGNVRAGQVISLVEVTGGLGSAIDAARLGDELGHKFQKTSKNKVKLLTDLIAKIEPFKTAVELATKQGSVSAEEVGEALSERGITWHHEPDMNQALLTTILIHWAIYAGLLNYNKNGRFEPIRRSH